MAERVARLADDRDEILNNLPTVESVFSLTKTEVTENTDVFARSGEFVKSLSGTTPNFKRRVTNELKKYNRSNDHEAESKQIDDQTAVNETDPSVFIPQPNPQKTLLPSLG